MITFRQKQRKLSNRKFIYECKWNLESSSILGLLVMEREISINVQDVELKGLPTLGEI